MKKKITTTAAALALSAALLAGSTPKASAANVNRTPGAFGLYIAGAEVERVFTADDDLVYWITDDDGERWIICADALAEISRRDDLPAVGQRCILIMNSNGTPDDFDDDYFADVLWSCCPDEED
jgi:hypothetical protein|nr:MAG TPA: hypothetical protein [Caudoviricetes sp.]